MEDAEGRVVQDVRESRDWEVTVQALKSVMVVEGKDEQEQEQDDEMIGSG